MREAAATIEAAVGAWIDGELKPEGVAKSAGSALGSISWSREAVEWLGEEVSAIEDFDAVVIGTPPPASSTPHEARVSLDDETVEGLSVAPPSWRDSFASIGYVSAAVSAADDLRDAGDLDGAEAGYRAAAEVGDEDGAERLADLLASQPGRVEETERLYREFAEGGDPRTLNNLGLFLIDQGRNDDAEPELRRSVAGGHNLAFANLGRVLTARAEDLEGEAEALYREGIELGDAHSVNNLGVLRAHRGKNDEALSLFERATAGGVSCAWRNRGIVLTRLGEAERAEQSYRRAAALGVKRTAYALGLLLKEQPDRRDEAEHWYRAAISEGDPMGHCGLGHLLEKDPECTPEAEAHFQAAIAAGLGHCRCGLARVLEQQGRIGEAKGLLRLLAAEGHTHARRRLLTLH